MRDSKSYSIDLHLPKHLNLCKRKESHCVKYGRIQVFSNPHFPVRRQNHRFCCILAYFTQCQSDVSDKKQKKKIKKYILQALQKPTFFHSLVYYVAIHSFIRDHSSSLKFGRLLFWPGPSWKYFSQPSSIF